MKAFGLGATFRWAPNATVGEEWIAKRGPLSRESLKPTYRPQSPFATEAITRRRQRNTRSSFDNSNADLLATKQPHD